jgi:hypothetical protein
MIERMRKISRAASFGAILAAMLLATLPALAQAQTSDAMQVHGAPGAGDVLPGDMIEAHINGEVVGSATADSDGWAIDITDGVDGDTVTFTINGEPANETVTFASGATEEATLTLGEAAPAADSDSMRVFGLTGVGDVDAGDTVDAHVNGQVVGTAEADAEGWIIEINAVTEGDTIAFTINGESAAETVAYEPAGLQEVQLTLGEAETLAGPAAPGEPAPAPGAPAPAETGDAGLLSATSASIGLVIALAIFAAAMVLGGRAATGWFAGSRQ